MDKTNKKDPKKWNFGALFRKKKKEIDSDSSSEEDRKAGFLPQKRKGNNNKKKRSSKIIGGFDHIVINPIDRYRETDSINSWDKLSSIDSTRSTGSLDRRVLRDRAKSRIENGRNSSSDEDSHNSLKSSNLSRFRSDESLANSSMRKSKTSRTDRYMKRLSRDDEGSSPIFPRDQQYSNKPNNVHPSNNGSSNSIEISMNFNNRGLRSSSSLTHVPLINGNLNGNRNLIQQHVRNHNYYNPPAKPEKRSVSYENSINRALSNKDLMKSPPIPPPRDPQRRLTVNNPVESRPISYAFDRPNPSQNNIWNINNRCVSDDKLWGTHNICSPPPQRPASAQPEPPQMRRFITRHESDSSQLNSNKNNGYKYITDLTPRSRRPILVVEDKVEISKPRTTASGYPAGIKSPIAKASNFWKKIDQDEVSRRTEISKPKPRSHSTTGHTEIIIQKPIFNRRASRDVVDNVVNGCLFIKPTMDAKPSFKVENKSNSMPNFYAPPQKLTAAPVNKYDEHVAKKKVQPIKNAPVVLKNNYLPPDPPRRSVSKRNSATEDDLSKKRKSANLEEAINELEAIYKSLRLGDEDLLDRAERRDIPTPTKFNKMLLRADYDDEEEDNGEPDILLDDVVYRNLKHANSILKNLEPQPKFGIPIVPVPPASETDYLHAQPIETKRPRFISKRTPDLVSDDLAFRALRKDSLGSDKETNKPEHFMNPTKKRAVRSMSANIYNLIQRDAAKPSGGSFFDYIALDKALEKAGSLTDLNVEPEVDVPSSLFIVKKNAHERRRKTEGDNLLPPCFGSNKTINNNSKGAVFNLPSTLKTSPSHLPFITKPPIPQPRHSISPDVLTSKKQDSIADLDDILAALAIEATANKERLEQDLKSVSSYTSSPEISQIERDDAMLLKVRKLNLSPTILDHSSIVDEIDEVSRAAQRCQDILKGVVEENLMSEDDFKIKLRIKEEKLIQEIVEVSDAAKICEQILDDVVREDLSPKMAEIVQLPIERSVSSISALMTQLNPEVNEIGHLAERCMKQIDSLGQVVAKEVIIEYDGPDYDNLNPGLMNDSPIHDYVNIAEAKSPIEEIIDVKLEKAEDSEEDIDRIMKEAEEVIRLSVLKRNSPIKESSEEEIDKIMSEKQISDFKTPQSSSLEDTSTQLISSSVTPNRINSSSITSFHAMSSSDYVKSPSSEYRPPSGLIKSSSTTSYDVKSSSVTPNPNQFSSFSFTPSPPLTPLGECSQYNSSEELAMIFGTQSTTGKNSEDLKCATKNLETILESHEEFCDVASFNDCSFTSILDIPSINLRLENSNNELLCNASLTDINECENFTIYKNEVEIITEEIAEDKNNNNFIKNEVIERKSRSSSSNEAGPSSNQSLSNSSPKRSSFIPLQHVLLACTLSMANSDLLTITAIIIAVITIIAILIL